MGECCQICVVESRGEVEDQGVGTSFRREKLTTSTCSEVRCGQTITGHSVTTKRSWCMVNDITEKLLDLDMEPKPESLWCTSTYKEEDVPM